MDYLSNQAYDIRRSVKGGGGMLGDQRGDGTGGARPAIELSGLTKRYRRGKGWLTAVNDVTLTVPRGQVIGLLGPNGAGKTTTIKMSCGLIAPTAGTIRINGYDVGLRERRNETVGSYSRGMQQKVAIAAALITDPPVMLLDEPTIGLDVESARTVKDWIAHLAAGEGTTIVLTTHQLPIVQELAERIAVIRDGSVIADLPTASLLARFAEHRFEVRVAGPPNGLAGKLPAGARAEADAGTTRVTLRDADQGRLADFLGELRAKDIPLLSVTQAQPGLEEIFLRLIGTGTGPAGTVGAEAERAGARA